MKYADQNKLIEKVSKYKMSEMSLQNRRDYLSARDKEIFKRKMGLQNETDTDSTYEMETFRDLSNEYGLSITRLQFIVRKEKNARN